MVAYAVVQRVATVGPRFGRAAAKRAPEADPAAGAADAIAGSLSGPVLESDSGPEALADRVASLRSALAQATWYLFNPEGWR